MKKTKIKQIIEEEIKKAKLAQIIKEEVERALMPEQFGGLGDLAGVAGDIAKGAGDVAKDVGAGKIDPKVIEKARAEAQKKIGVWNPLGLALDLKEVFGKEWEAYLDNVSRRARKECVEWAWAIPPYEINEACVRKVAIQEATKSLARAPQALAQVILRLGGDPDPTKGIPGIEIPDILMGPGIVSRSFMKELKPEERF